MSSPSSSAAPPHHPAPPSSSSQPLSRQHHRSASDTTTLVPDRPHHAASRSTSNFPFSFIRSFQSNPSPTAFVSSNAEGRPIPVDDSTVESRTSALRELNHNYPSRHRYERSTGAENTTYSEPVIVRSYHPPVPSRPPSTTTSRRGGGVLVHGGAGTSTVSQSGSSATAERRLLPFSATVTTARNGMLSRMGRSSKRSYGADKAGPEDAELPDAKLPPIEAFTFKSFLDNMNPHDDDGTGPPGDINADLDRIAEICAKSRYSLSNQYEVHFAPHGSGASFLGVTPRGVPDAGPDAQAQNHPGPTLQAVSSDDERSMKRQRRQQQRHGLRRNNSRAMGTLETIMSSSRSSDEERSRKRPAAELADEVRGRASTSRTDYSGRSSPTSSRHSAPSQPPHTPRRHSTSLALIDNVPNDAQSATAPQGSPRTSGSSLVGQPVQPQASTSHLEIRTTPKQPKDTAPQPTPVRSTTAPADGILSTISGWIPWRSVDRNPVGRAEGSLRDLLRSDADAR